MKTFARYLVGSAIALCLLVTGIAVAQQQGTPWTGEAGISATVDELQVAQRNNDARIAGTARPARIRPFRKADRANNRDNPESANLVAGPKTAAVERAGVGPKAAQTLSTSFTGATLADTGAFPPDSMGAVGPTQFIVAVNGRIRSFDKTTGAADGVLNLDTDVFFASVMTLPLATNFTSDPRIRYDRLSGRWIVTMVDVPGGAGTLPNRVMIAVSNTSTITNSTVWTYFQFQQDQVAPLGDTGFLADYPTLGVDANALYIGVNMFDSGGNFRNSTAFVVRKSSVLGAGPIVVTAFRNLITLSGNFPGPYAPQGVDNFDAAATEGYFIGVDAGLFGLLQMRRVTTPGGTPTLSANIPITVANTAFPARVPHLGNTGGANGQLDGLDDRLYAAQVRNGQLWTAHNIGTNAAGAATSNASTLRNAVRWYQFGNLTGTPSITQSGQVQDSVNGNGSNANWYWIPSINVNGQGHAALGFSAAGITRADAAFTGRLASDTLGTMPGPLTRITNTTFNYNPPSDPGGASGRRWGDFSYTSVDPLDDMSIWTIQEFTDATNSYGVRVAKLNAPPPATPATPAPSSVAGGQPSVNVTLTGTSIAGSGFFDPGTDLPAPSIPFHHISASVTGGVIVNSVTYVGPTSVTLNLSTVAATLGTHSITITNPDGQSLTGTNILTTTGIAQTIIFGALGNKTFGDADFAVSATGGGSGNPVTFSAAPPTVCTVSGNLVSLTGAGTCTITADQAGNATYIAAPSVPQSFTVAQAAQTISFGALGNKTFGDAPFGVSATGGGAGDPVTFSSLTTGVCTVAGSTVTIVAAGTCTIAADQAGNTNYLPAPQATQSFTVAQATQTISFGALGNKAYGDPAFAVSATGGGSGNPVTFSSQTTGVCTVSGNMVTIVAVGTCTIAADQVGNTNYLAASQVLQGFTVTAGPAASVTATGGAAQSAAINTDYTAPLTATVKDAGNNAVLGASVQFDLPASGASGTFPGALTTAIVATDVNGVATSPTVTANGTIGPFLATATVSGVATPASFNLLNTSGAAYTIVVTPTTPDWTFLTESGTGAGSFVTGPGTAPAGNGSVELQAVTPDGGEYFYTQQFAGMRIDTVKGLQFSTFVNAGVNDLALGFDVDADLTSPTTVYEGRLVFAPDLVAGSPVIPGIWQTWDAYTQKGWYGSRAPINAICTMAAPCTLADVLAVYPNAGVIAGLFAGEFGFKLGNNGATGTVSVDKLVMVREGPPATLTAWTYDFELVSPAAATITATVGTPQSTAVNTAFAMPLTAQVRDAANQLLSGVTVTFDLPASGASGTFPGSVISATAVTTSVIGEATSPAVTANGFAGVYAAGASAAAATAASFALTNTQGATTTAVVSSLNPSTFGATVTFTATVGPAAATGTVTFFDGATLLGTGTLAGGTATFATSALAVASHAITAVYGGDANYTGGASLIMSQVVDQATTTTGFGTAPNPSTYAQSVTLTATVAPSTATGSVTFFDGATNLGTGAVSAGMASIGTSAFTAGSHVLTAVYGGDASYLGSTSPPVTQVVNQATTSTAVVGAPNPSAFGQAVTFTATVAPAAATGTVTFSDGVTVLGTGAVTGGVATFTTSAALATGTHVITAAYGGDASYQSSSGTVSQVVNQVPTSITATGGTPQSAVISTAFGAALVATVKDASAFGVPGITVTFTLPASGASGAFPGSVTTASVTTDASGVATSPIVTANSTAGSYNVTAAAAGVATPASFALTNTAGAPSSITATAGTPQSTMVTTTFGAALQATVKDSGNNAVAGATVTFTLPASGASGTFPGAVLTASVTTNASGVALSPLVTANATVGSYSATATVTGVVTAATFSLQNTPPTVVAALTIMGGGGQSTRVSTAFPTMLTVKATDSGGNPVPNATVQFVVPTLGASATLSATSAITDSGGLASITATASAISGAYQVTATSGAPSASFNLTNTITISVGNTCGGIGATNTDLVEQYYAAILRRPSDAGGKAFWMGEADRLCALGVDPRQTFLVMGEVFFNTPEYIAQNRDNTGFVTDLYVTFLSRLPDTAGLNYWKGQITTGMPRNNVMNSFLFSPEFTAMMGGAFPGRTARAESYLVMNLYGGFFRRLADSAGYTYWTGQFRLAQCQSNPAGAVQGTINNVSNQFVTSPEYVARNTSNSQIVQDLYYAMLQRGGDLTGFNFWLGKLNGSVMTRSQVRQQFLTSPEMTAQSAAIAAQGCVP